MKIGILGAMIEEVSSIKEMMIVERETTIGGRTYFEGKINNKDVVVVFSRWGKVAAASTTATLINLFKVNFILFTGVAGAVASHLNIGDIVIGNGLYQHDMDARPFFNQFQIPLTTSIVLEPKAVDVQTAKIAVERFIDNISNHFSSDILQQYSISKPSVHVGLIASGDKFISDPNTHSDLSFTINENKTLAVEMEGASVAQVCEDYNVSYIVLRVISDKADHSAIFDFQSFIKGIASKYAAVIVREYLSLKVDVPIYESADL